MSDTLHLNYSDVIAYVNTATDLAESVKQDIKRDNKISIGTIVLLNKFIIVANSISDLTNQAAKDYSESN